MLIPTFPSLQNVKEGTFFAMISHAHVYVTHILKCHFLAILASFEIILFSFFQIFEIQAHIGGVLYLLSLYSRTRSASGNVNFALSSSLSRVTGKLCANFSNATEEPPKNIFKIKCSFFTNLQLTCKYLC